MSLLGLDVGTTGCKAVAFNLKGQLLAQAYREYPLLHPQPGWAELDIHLLWQSITEVIKSVNDQIKTDPVQALSVSCQGEAVTAVDSGGNPLCNFIVTFDHRTVEQADWWQGSCGPEKIFSLTGMPLHAMYSINKIMWFKAHQPDLYAQAVKFLCVEDYINYRLTGNAVSDWSLAARTMAFDVSKKCWSTEILKTADVSEELLPETKASGNAIGQIDAKLSDELGFGRDVIVATGGHDQPCGALGAGVIEPGVAMNATGTSDVACPVLAEVNLSKEMLAGNYCCYPHVANDCYVSIAFNLTGGLLLRWYRDTFFQQETADAVKNNRDIYESIIESASDKIKCLFFLPHFVGAGTPYLDSDSRGALVGLTIDTSREELSKAVLDSTNYEMLLNIETMDHAGLKVHELRAIGGGAKSRRWLQMKADVFGLPVASMAVSEAAALGAAMLAGLSIGVFSDAQESVSAMVRIIDYYQPREEEHRLYKETYQHYKQLYSVLKDFNQIMTQADRKRS